MAEWEAYFMLEPLGEERQDIRFAQLCQLLGNIHRSKKQAKFKIEDFLLNFDKPKKKKQSVSDMKNILLGLSNKGKK